MPEDEICKAELIIARLKAEGWKKQQSGTVYINGTIGINLLKDGEVITVQQEFYPDEEFLEQEWPDEKHIEPDPFAGDENGNNT
ncbi:MAG: hypothetical protein JSU94_08255 [Phycisphaerales bacterium]|nr:MAG: hypothetical protein JSU94_08255 [Phycisphaerales bacterium]